MEKKSNEDWSEKLIEWIHSEEGQKSLEEADRVSKEAILELRRSIRFTPEELRKLLNTPFTYSASV